MPLVRLGVHVSIQGGLCEALKRARLLGCGAMQVFSRSPRNWKGLRLEAQDVERFKEERIKFGVFPLVVHIPYLVNLSSPEEGLYKKSISTFVEDIKTAERMGAEYFVTHLGSHRGRGEGFGIDRLSKALNFIIKKTAPRLMVLLETTAGSGNSLGYRFEQIKDILEGIERKDKIGVCLDTAHAYAAGYDIATKKGLNTTLKRFDEFIGLDKLKVIHLNDSKAALGSGVDRHQHIGRGKIGKAGMALILNHPKLKKMTFILETPKQTISSDRKNLEAVKKLAN